MPKSLSKRDQELWQSIKKEVGILFDAGNEFSLRDQDNDIILSMNNKEYHFLKMNPFRLYLTDDVFIDEPLEEVIAMRIRYPDEDLYPKFKEEHKKKQEEIVEESRAKQ